LLDLENPLFGATFMALCVILAELWLEPKITTLSYTEAEL